MVVTKMGVMEEWIVVGLPVFTSAFVLESLQFILVLKLGIYNILFSFLFAGFLFALIQPYRKAWLNKLDISMFLLVAIITV